MTARQKHLLESPVAYACFWVFVLVFGLFLTFVPAAMAQQAPKGAENMSVVATIQDGYGRIVLTFPERTNIPDYKLGWDNGVLVVAFQVPVKVSMPDLSEELQEFVSAARLDPDGKGLRIGLKHEYKVNKTEAGERLFIDILPENWTGIEPGLPRDIVEQLSERARVGVLEQERQQRAEYVLKNDPTVSVQVGRHPTFLRLLFDWSMDASGELTREGDLWRVQFDWPVPVGLYDLKADLPAEILDVSNRVDRTGSALDFRLADGIEPRFYKMDARHFAFDIDLPSGVSEEVDLASLLPDGASEPKVDNTKVYKRDEPARQVIAAAPEQRNAPRITPFVETVGKSVRIVFPFQEDTAAAVFRRGETLWMIFDTDSSIGAPDEDGSLKSMVSEMTIQPAGQTAVVRLGLRDNKLATLGSEGRSWVLALGDSLLTPAELITLGRRQTSEGMFEITADIDRPSRVHEVSDPEVGDVLSVVTAFPPARGVVRDFDFVDFTALRSVHGLVIQPTHEGVDVEIESRNAVIRSDYGLIISAPQMTRLKQDAERAAERESFVDLKVYEEPDVNVFVERLKDTTAQIAEAPAEEVEYRRFDMAKLYLANRYYLEAAGIMRLMREEGAAQSAQLLIAEAAAQVMAGRWTDGLKILGEEDVAGSPDALIWRTIARVHTGDYSGARRDALVAELSLDGYPDWVQQEFLLAATEAAIEDQDIAFANRSLSLVDTAGLAQQDLTHYEILAARLDEAAGRLDEALDTFGQVITADIRPTRAEAIYRTMVLLDKMGRLDLLKAADTLASEVLLWRGDVLESSMLKLLAELNFRNGDYRHAFETVRALATARPDAPPTQELLETARQIFADLYLNGQADVLAPIDALTLYYDYRTFTPSGARGDEMVRNLVRRLIKFDLLEQAGELLQYQVDERLEGAAKAQIAADLAIVYLAQRRPDKALEALNSTRVAGIAPGLERQRRILEARALIDADREDLAIDLLNSMDGRDADLLRVDAQWRAKRYRQASEILEQFYADIYQEGNLPTSGRQNIIKAAVGYVLAADTIGVGRLRERFSQAMAETPEWPLFDFVTGNVTLTSREFKRIAQDVTGADSLGAFLATYRDVYGVDGALAPTGKNGA